VVQIGLQDLRKNIRDQFYTDQLTLKESPEMSATEVVARMELMSQLIGPTLGRIMHELLNRTVERVFGLMARARALGTPPPKFQDYVKRLGSADIEYQSPLARAQRLPEVAALTRTIGLVQPMQAVAPDILDNFDLDVAAREVAAINGVSPRLIRSREEVSQIRALRAEQQVYQQQLADAAQVAKAAGDAAPMVKALAPASAGGAA
jgi:hypothetical protein